MRLKGLKVSTFKVSTPQFTNNMATNKPFNPMTIILTIVKIFGAFPTKTISYKRFNISVAYSFVILLAFLSIFIGSFPVLNDEKEINYIINRIVAVISTLTFITILFVAIIYRNKLRKINRKLDILKEDNLIKMYSKRNDQKIGFLSAFLIFIAILLLTETCIADAMVLKPYEEIYSTLKWLVVVLPMVLNTFYQILISVYGYFLTQCFKIINKTLAKFPSFKNINNDLHDRENDDVNSNYYVEHIKNIKILNEELRNLANDICSCFSLPILVSAGSGFFMITVQIYYLLMVVVLPAPKKDIRRTSNIKPTDSTVDKIPEEERWKFTLCLINYMIVYFLQLVIVMGSFHLAKNQVSTKDVSKVLEVDKKRLPNSILTVT